MAQHDRTPPRVGDIVYARGASHGRWVHHMDEHEVHLLDMGCDPGVDVISRKDFERTWHTEK